MKRFQWLMALGAVCLLVAACGGSSSSGTSSASGSSTSTSAAVTGGKVAGKLVVDNESGSTWTCQFNPFNPAVTLVSFGWVYEPLEYVNILKTGSVTPWLASSSAWSNGFKTLTFTVRSGATWSDGQPFSADDVAYTFNAMKSDKAIDLNAIWKADGGPLTDVTQKGNQVVFTFASPSEPYFYLIADQTPIVPKHIWSTLNQSSLHSYTDTKPVGTGPYLVSNCAPQNIKYLNNPHYWQSTAGHPVPAVKEVDYPAFLSNTAANLVLSQGGAQWGGQYIPNIQSFYISKDPANRHYWFAPVLNVSLFPNLTNPVLSQLPVRQAISLAIDRATVSRLGESGYQAPANQTGVVLPTFSSWSDSSLATTTTFSPSKAEQTLTSAGFTKGSDGIFKDKSGNPLSFTIKTISGYSDWDSSLQLITQQLKAVGIKVTVQDQNTTSYTADLQAGHFQLAYGGSGGPAPSPGPSPYYELRGLLFGGNIGSTNYERFKSPSTDALFNQYSSASQADQVNIIHQIQKVMVDQVPLIPVTEGVDWYQYDTSHFAGWPTQANPYAQPAPYQAPDMGVVLTHLVPTG
jgi:peptide/nickel transport system substrate-binding protein